VIEKILGWLAFTTMIIALYLVFVQSPLERVMRELQKIFYFHVASAWVGMFAFFIVFVCSILYLITRKDKWDIYAYTSAELGVAFTTIVLITGPIWARGWWTKWWVWDARLTTTLIMWFLYLAYGMIRTYIGEEEKRSRFAAVFGILAFADVPIAWFAIRWWSNMHPVLITGESTGLASGMKPAFFTSIIAFTLLYLYLWLKSIQIEKVRTELNIIKENVVDL
jgi:heme exporter protein C